MKFVLDADSLIRSKRQHYAFDICPGFWKALEFHFKQGTVGSIVNIRNEVSGGKDSLDSLAIWVKRLPKSVFAEIDDQSVEEYRKVVTKIQADKTYHPSAKRKFLKGADPWLIAFAKTHQLTLVTYEVRSQSPNKIKLPDVGDMFGVSCIPPYVMARQLGIKLMFSHS
jgi:hypothetical protein